MLAFATLSILSSLAVAQGRAPALFQSAPGAALAPEQAVSRARNVAPAFGAMQAAVAALRARPGTPVTMQADFFLDAPVTLRFERTELLPDGTEALIGGVEGDAYGSAVLVFKDGILSANVNANRRAFQIRSRGHAVHEVREMDTAEMREAAGDMVEPPPESKAYAPPLYAGMMADDGTTIDVIVLYSTAARAGAGSTAAMESQVNLGITETNTAYASSGVTQRLRLVYTGEVAYTDAGNMSTDLGRLRTAGDGFLEEAQTLRDTYGADLVSLWVENGAGSCGIGYFMATVSASFASSGYNVVARNCATGNYSFGHELGHNMGLRHDTFIDAGVTPYAWAHGYVDLANRFRTIMAYNDQCAATPPGTSCIRIQYFSNPAVTYTGFTTGNASTAHASRVLNDTALTVANFRTAIPAAGNLGFSPATYSVNETGGSVTLSVVRTAGTLGAVSVQYATANGSATAGSDYTATSGTLSWANGESGAKTFAVPISNDGLNEGLETFTASLSNATGGAAINAGTATVSILESTPDVFPRNCAMPAGWVTPAGATAGWSVDATQGSEGSCSLRSDAIGNSAGSGLYTKAQIEFTGTFLAGNITFSRKTSSEAGWDCLRFLLDGVQQVIGGSCGFTGGLGASGEDPWTAVSIPVTAGPHTIRWSFERDEIEGGGSNAAWIDNVVLPLAASTTALASSANPSAVSANVTFTATVSGAAGTPTGTVLFKSDGTALPGCSAVALSSGSATCSTAALSTGTHAITAEYSGNAVYNYSVSTTLNQVVGTLSLASVASRKTHAGAGALDVTVDASIAVGGAVSVDPRGAAPGHTLVFTFSAPVSVAGSVSATDGTGFGIGSASALASGNTVVVSLSGIADAKRVKVTLTGVNGVTNASASTGFLVGDADGTRTVASADVDAVKAKSGLAADAATARYDLDLSGAVTASDILRTKGRIGNSV